MKTVFLAIEHREYYDRAAGMSTLQAGRVPPPLSLSLSLSLLSQLYVPTGRSHRTGSAAFPST